MRGIFHFSFVLSYLKTCLGIDLGHLAQTTVVDIGACVAAGGSDATPIDGFAHNIGGGIVAGQQEVVQRVGHVAGHGAAHGSVSLLSHGSEVANCTARDQRERVRERERIQRGCYYLLSRP